MPVASRSRDFASERRVHPRVPARVPISIRTDAQVFAGVAQDLSPSGVFVSTWRRVAIGTDVQLELELEDEVVRVRGRVRWARTPQNDDAPGIGIAFSALDDDARDVLQEFCEVRLPLAEAEEEEEEA